MVVWRPISRLIRTHTHIHTQEFFEIRLIVFVTPMVRSLNTVKFFLFGKEGGIVCCVVLCCVVLCCVGLGFI